MSEFVVALSAVFITAGVFLIIANRLGLPSIPFYIVAGLVVGGFLEQPALLDLALWGVAFLVFVFGSSIDMGDIQSVMRDGESAAFTQIIIVAPISLIAGYLLIGAFGIDDPFRNALYFSAAATLSSTLVGKEIREVDIRSNLVHGRLASSIHFFDDIVAIGVLLVLSAEVITDPQLVTSKIGYGVLFLLSGLLIYRHGYPLLVRAADHGDELVLMGSISILIAFIALAEYIEISIVVGAFAAGIAIRSEGAELLNVRNGIESIKDFFAAIFFVTVGALVSLPHLDTLVLALLLVILVSLINPFIHMVAFVIEGYDGRSSFVASTSLNQVSELAIVVAIQGLLLGTIATSIFEAIILAAAITMVLSTMTGRYENAIYDRFLDPLLAGRTDYIDAHSHVDPDLRDHVILVGFGRQGRRLATTFEEIQIPYVVIENDPTRLDALQSEAKNYVFGDAIAEYPIKQCHIDRARLVISTVDHRPVSEALLAFETDADIIIRANSSPVAEELLSRGATLAVVPSVMASDQLVEQVERVLGDKTAIEQIEADHRQYLRNIEMAGLERKLDLR